MARAKTKIEARDEFMHSLAGMAYYWGTLSERSALDKCNGLAFSILAMFDGSNIELPAMNISLSPHPDDKEYLRSQGDNWFEPDQIINDDVTLHEMWHKYQKEK